MYSVVLMAALTAGGETPDFCHRRCSGCSGCYSACHGGYGYSGCYGCSGYGYGHGCCSRYGAGYGCCSASFGYSGYGCCSSYGYAGGCYGSCAGGYGCSAYGHTMIGCYGGGVGVGCYGGGIGCYAMPGYGYSPVPTVGAEHLPVVPMGPPTDLPSDGSKEEKKDKKIDQEASVQANKARLVVEVPADAKVYIDDQLMKTKDEVRKYTTPALQPGQQYYYVVKAEVVRDGKTESETKRVVVKAGEESRLSFDKLESVATAKAGR